MKQKKCKKKFERENIFLKTELVPLELFWGE